jgi:MFS family permease
MTLFGSTANDASFNAWVTDNTVEKNRGTVEGVLAILPLVAMLIVAGGFGILVELIGYPVLFLLLGIIISLSGILGLFVLRDKDGLVKSGSLKDIFYGLYPSVIKANPRLYLALIIVLIYGIACQIFMPYMIIYMKTYLDFSVVEYSVIFGLAILLGAGVNLYLTRLSDRKDKASLMYIAASVMALGLFAMYLSRGMDKTANLILFGISGFVMIVGYIFTSALCGAIVRDNTPPSDVGKLQGVRMIFSVLIPMLLGPAIGNAINKARNIPLPEGSGADVMTTAYIPAPEIFLAGAVTAILMLAVIPFLKKVKNK